jgi:hypothetical protein
MKAGIVGLPNWKINVILIYQMQKRKVPNFVHEPNIGVKRLI